MRTVLAKEDGDARIRSSHVRNHVRPRAAALGQKDFGQGDRATSRAKGSVQSMLTFNLAAECRRMLPGRLRGGGGAFRGNRVADICAAVRLCTGRAGLRRTRTCAPHSALQQQLVTALTLLGVGAVFARTGEYLLLAFASLGAYACRCSRYSPRRRQVSRALLECVLAARRVPAPDGGQVGAVRGARVHCLATCVADARRHRHGDSLPRSLFFRPPRVHASQRRRNRRRCARCSPRDEVPAGRNVRADGRGRVTWIGFVFIE